MNTVAGSTTICKQLTSYLA